MGTGCVLGGLNSRIPPWLLRPVGTLVWLIVYVTPGPLALDLRASKSCPISPQQPYQVRAPELCPFHLSWEGGIITPGSAKSSQSPTPNLTPPPSFPWYRLPLAFLSHFVAGFCRSRSPLDRPAPLREVRALSGEPWIHPYDLVTASRHFVRQGPLPGHPDPSGIPGATGGHPLNRAGTGPCFSKHFLRLLAYSAPLLHPLWLPVSSLCLHPDHHHSRPPAHLWPLEPGGG